MILREPAYQRAIAEQRAAADPRTRLTNLDSCAVETIARADASPIIERYEWLGGIGPRTEYFVGLISGTRELLGVACFGHGPGGSISDIIGAPALCLERGACVHYAPPNAASFLINRACKLLYRIDGIHRFFAYADPMAGEYGAVYQAAGWLYLGQGLDGSQGRRRRYFVLAPGLDRNVPQNWKTTRVFRRQGKPRLDFKTARALGWQIADRAAKHVYVAYVGGSSKERSKWRQGITARDYPKPHLSADICACSMKKD